MALLAAGGMALPAVEALSGEGSFTLTLLTEYWVCEYRYSDNVNWHHFPYADVDVRCVAR